MLNAKFAAYFQNTIRTPLSCDTYDVAYLCPLCIFHLVFLHRLSHEK